MINPVISYISQNAADIIKDIIFAFIGVFLGIVFTPKDSDQTRSSNITLVQAKIIIQQMILYDNTQTNTQQVSNNPQTSNNNDDSLFYIMIAVIFILYTKYHIVMINYFTAFTLLALTCTITIAIKLHMNNNLDKFNKHWLILLFFIILIDFANLVLMSKQSVITGGNISSFLKVLYYVLGFIMSIIPNIFMILILIHLFAFNSFIVRRGKISLYFLKKTKSFTNSPKASTAFITLFSILTVALSSGVAYNLITYLNEKNVNSFINNFSR
ncbi:hypothetical protein [Clostridium sp. DJ247]|uniref:hypothetical protein n=1 Tax=Clostridium sp. DJ247 TaxID=2726188 RepID=UPI001627FF15|nr:hypothetical protein [Clostridium sp. DJ247]MBC2580585.1 hypothetical protein [Clostridium sp. DJ247]